MASEEKEGAEEDTAGSCGQQNDGVAIGGLGFRWGCGGIILALGATLGVC